MNFRAYYSDRLLGDEAGAKAAIEKMVADYADNDDAVRKVAGVVDRFADEYRKSGNYERARELYQLVVDTWAEFEQAAQSQSGVARCCILLGDDPNAQVAIEKLMTDFPNHKRLALAIDHLADTYGDLGKIEKARELYQLVVDRWPEAKHAIQSQAGVVRSYIALGDDVKAKAAIGKLIRDFSSASNLVGALEEIGEMYEEAGRYAKAEEICQQIIKIDPNSSEARKAVLDIAKVDILSLIETGDDANALMGINKLMVDFNGHPDLAAAIFQIGEQYYNMAFSYKKDAHEAKMKEHFAKAIAVWERIIQELPVSATTAQAYYFSARCYRQLGEYEKSIEYYQKVISDWPGHKYVWDAKFMIARCLKELKNSGCIPK